ncbi:hypothetical protein SAMYPH_81 [Streptomyces phage Samy]|uniref:hypothetical protein n=1 Tax=Streptomyces ambofaciens TaxID=1889 RepID=UPI00069D20C7|nr:hypothetical protein [Streptomyces ambofaciens]WNA15412.1 hypothetical protein SAMYPH_81 [Streptomyces phage Samy]
MTEYDYYNPPPPGVRVSTDFGDYATCHACGGFTTVWRDGLLALHDRPRAGGQCPASWSAADLESAIARDDRLNPEEETASSWAWRWVSMCRGYQTLSNGSTEHCWHPICEERKAKGIYWTLSGWRRRDVA